MEPDVNDRVNFIHRTMPDTLRRAYCNKHLRYLQWCQHHPTYGLLPPDQRFLANSDKIYEFFAGYEFPSQSQETVMSLASFELYVCALIKIYSVEKETGVNPYPNPRSCEPLKSYLVEQRRLLKHQKGKSPMRKLHHRRMASVSNISEEEQEEADESLTSQHQGEGEAVENQPSIKRRKRFVTKKSTRYLQEQVAPIDKLREDDPIDQVPTDLEDQPPKEDLDHKTALDCLCLATIGDTSTFEVEAMQDKDVDMQNFMALNASLRNRQDTLAGRLSSLESQLKRITHDLAEVVDCVHEYFNHGSSNGSGGCEGLRNSGGWST